MCTGSAGPQGPHSGSPSSRPAEWPLSPFPRGLVLAWLGLVLPEGWRPQMLSATGKGGHKALLLVRARPE